MIVSSGKTPPPESARTRPANQGMGRSQGTVEISMPRVSGRSGICGGDKGWVEDWSSIAYINYFPVHVIDRTFIIMKQPLFGWG